MRVLFLSNEQFLPISGGGSIGNFKIVERMAKCGYDVTVATPLYLGAKEVQDIEKRYNIRLRSFSPFYIHKNVSFRGPKYLIYSLLYSIHVLKLYLGGKYDVIFVRNCLLAFPAIILRPLAASSLFSLSITDFLTGFLYNNSKYPPFVVKAMFWAERFVPRLFDIVFVITPEMKRILMGGGCQPSRVYVSYDGVDGAIFDPKAISVEDVDSIRRRLGIGRKIVLFHGTIDDHAMLKLRETIRAVSAQRSDVTFILLGQGKKYDELKAEMGSEHALFPGYVPHTEIPKYAAAADVGIIPYEKNFNSNLILTLKLLEYLSMGLPVVSTDLRSVSELFGSYDFVRIAASPQEFADDVVRMLDYGKSQRAIDLIRDNYSWDRVTQGMIDTIEEKRKISGLSTS
jgi:glycosyltransferase involved in cell wall biosynthesis